MKRIEFISMEDFTKLYKAAKGKDLKVAMILGFGSGLRISEIVGLEKQYSKCCDCEITKERMMIDGKNRKVIVCPKCNQIITLKEVRRKIGDYTIPRLTPDMINLKEHKINLTLAKGNKWRTTVTSPSLTEEKIKILPLKTARRTLQHQFSRLTEQVLGRRLNFHVLRHGFGNYQANVLRTPLPIVQQLMGHSRLDTTGIYTKANPEYAISEAWKAMTGEK
jgi:integrase